ncbi:MAG: hypothetical protein OEV64_04970 [Desulfobulbaceae bacterium]|nr:hypothetical protein [Desulfobulbaceae bacterium]
MAKIKRRNRDEKRERMGREKIEQKRTVTIFARFAFRFLEQNRATKSACEKNYKK